MNDSLIQQKIVDAIDDPKTLASLSMVSKGFAQTVKRRKTLDLAKAKISKDTADLRQTGKYKKAAVKSMNKSILNDVSSSKNIHANLTRWATTKPKYGKFTNSRKRKVAKHILKQKLKKKNEKNQTQKNEKNEALHMALKKLKIFA